MHWWCFSWHARACATCAQDLEESAEDADNGLGNEGKPIGSFVVVELPEPPIAPCEVTGCIRAFEAIEEAPQALLCTGALLDVVEDPSDFAISGDGGR